jgi:hypothetical protein
MASSPAEQNSTTFISYASNDAEFALRLARHLRVAGAAIWIDKLDIAAGVRWDRAVQHGLEVCPRLLVILSPSSVSSENVLDEVSYALDEGKEVIPALYRDCQIPFRLRRLQRIDIRNGIAELLQALGVEPREGAADTRPIPASDPVLAPEDVRPPYLGPYSIEQATIEDIRWIAGFTERAFGSPDDHPGEDKYLEWWTANPSGFSIIRNRDGKNVGNIDIMPLRPDALERFRAGTLLERNFRGSDFNRIDERKEIRALYVGSVATTIDRDTAPREVEPHAADTALQMLPVLVDRVCDKQPTTMIYALAATPKGSRLLEACRFKKCAHSQDRPDNHDLYCASLLECISPLSVICRGGLVLDDTWRALLAQARA